MGCGTSTPSSTRSHSEDQHQSNNVAKPKVAEVHDAGAKLKEEATDAVSPMASEKRTAKDEQLRKSSFQEGSFRMSATRQGMGRSDNVWKEGLEDEYFVDDGRPLGRGSFGTVKKCTHIDTGKQFAVKCIDKARLKGDDMKTLHTEVNAMRIIGKSLNSIMLKDTYEDEKSFYIVMELCTGGELYGRIQEGSYTEAYVVHLVRNMTQFVAQCHAKHVCFRDIKPGNFLFLNEDEDSPLKGADFGLAVYHNEGDPPLKDMCGTPYYMAPDVIRGGYGLQCDMWSLGAVAYQLLCGRLPYPGPPPSLGLGPKKRTLDIFRAIITYEPIDFETAPWPNISPLAKDFVQSCLQYEPEERMAAKEALKHPWLAVDRTSQMTAHLTGTVVQRLQLFSWYGAFKQTLLKQIILRVIKMDESEVQKLSTLFNQLDVNKDGTLTPKELRDGLDATGYHVTVEEMDKITEIVDADKSGAIDYEEFVAALVDWRCRSKSNRWKDASIAVFNELDKDSDGKLDASEVASILGGSTSEDPRVREAILEADMDGDGKITLDEFVHLVQPLESDDLSIFDKRLASTRRPSMRAMMHDRSSIEKMLFSATKLYEQKTKQRATAGTNSFKNARLKKTASSDGNHVGEGGSAAAAADGEGAATASPRMVLPTNPGDSARMGVRSHVPDMLEDLGSDGEAVGQHRTGRGAGRPMSAGGDSGKATAGSSPATTTTSAGNASGQVGRQNSQPLSVGGVSIHEEDDAAGLDARGNEH